MINVLIGIGVGIIGILIVDEVTIWKYRFVVFVAFHGTFRRITVFISWARLRKIRELLGGGFLRAKYLKFDGFGDPQDVLKVDYKSIEPPMENEIFVRMIKRPINPSDLIPIRGAYSHRTSLPAVPGYEGIGVVEEVGPSVSKKRIGKRVLPLRGEGTWQEFVKAPADLAVCIPDFIDDDMASQLYINPLTVWLICTKVLKLGAGDVLLVNACGSSIGRIFAQLSKVLGFSLVAITRNNNYTEKLRRLGASHVINTAENQLHQTVMELTNGSGANAAVDSIGGSSGTNLAYCLQPNGIFLTIGLLSGIQVNWSKISRETEVAVKMFHLRHWNREATTQTWYQAFNRLITLLKDGDLKLMAPESHYSLSEIREAVQVAESAKGNEGKVILTNG